MNFGLSIKICFPLFVSFAINHAFPLREIYILFLQPRKESGKASTNIINSSWSANNQIQYFQITVLPTPLAVSASAMHLLTEIIVFDKYKSAYFFLKTQMLRTSIRQSTVARTTILPAC